jgi:hypothetical protein
LPKKGLSFQWAFWLLNFKNAYDFVLSFPLWDSLLCSLIFPLKTVIHCVFLCSENPFFSPQSVSKYCYSRTNLQLLIHVLLQLYLKVTFQFLVNMSKKNQNALKCHLNTYFCVQECVCIYVNIHVGTLFWYFWIILAHFLQLLKMIIWAKIPLWL